MSSDTAALLETRCSMCSLRCPVVLERFAPDGFRPVYPAGSEGLCVRGHMICDLTASPLRLYEPALSVSGGQRYISLADALWRAASLGSDGAEVHIWLDGNLPAEQLKRCVDWARRWRPQCSIAVYLPPADRDAVAGLLASRIQPDEPAQLAEVDGYLIFGDPLVTHPLVARRMLEQRRRRPRMPWVVVDSAAGVTSQFAAVRLVVRPGFEPALAEWFAGRMTGSRDRRDATAAGETQRLADACGLDADEMVRAVEALKAAGRLGVVVAPQTGRTADWSAVVEELARLASAADAVVVLLTMYPHALEVLSEAVSLGFGDVGEAVRSLRRADRADLLVVGWDPASALPERIWRDAVESARRVVAAVPFADGIAERAGLLLPLAMPFEARARGVLEPPAGVLTAAEMLERLAAYAGGDRGAEAPPEPLQAAGPELQQAAAKRTHDTLRAQAVLMAEPAHFEDGYLTRRTGWAEQWGPLPRVLISPDDAQALGVSDGWRVELQNEHGSVQACCRVVPGQPNGQIAVSAAWPQVRTLADWRIGTDGLVRCGPFTVTVERI